MRTFTNIIHPAFVLFAFACFALSQSAQALLPPPAPDGGYPNQNTAEGTNALFSLTRGTDNTAVGYQALYSNQGSSELPGLGSHNTAIGSLALHSNTLGPANTATGADALSNNIFGFSNVANGYEALLNSTGSNNIALGSQAGINLTTGSHNIDIGNVGVSGESGSIRIGMSGTQTKTFIAGIRGAVVPTGIAVIVGSTGRLGTTASSGRFKEAIQPMDKSSEAILALKPVTFRYKHEFDPDGIPQFGLMAEEVEKVNRALVAYDDYGKPYTVRYDAVNAMLLNEFLKEHHQVQDLKTIVAEQQKEIEALTAGLQKVSAQLEVNKPGPQTVKNND